jgi:hypothetical protein
MKVSQQKKSGLTQDPADGRSAPAGEPNRSLADI